MRFSLQDVKKSVRRQQGDLTVSLHFLHQGEQARELAQLIVYYERLLGQPQRLFSLDDARACVGDYRLAHCLLATLSHWYMWRQPDWTEAVQRMSQHPDLSDITSPIHLRLALYSYVNAHHNGFLATQTRESALHTFATTHGLTAQELEYLLALDTEEEARLVRATPTPPTPQEVATLYNQWVFEAALFNASSVRFLIDCAAFSKSQLTTSTGVGAVIKRLCYIARKLGVYYDLAYEPMLTGMPPLLSLTLYGPQEVTGSAQQYGLRLARLCRILMGYGLTSVSGDAPRKVKKASFANTIVEAAATVHFLHRSYAFKMDAALLHLLPPQEVPADAQSSSYVPEQQIFDSSIEQSFAEAFMALAGSQGVDGWRLEREPEPLLLNRSIFIPDFALTRAQRRIYVEILGFWTPTYRERKLQKLLQLQDRKDLVLAIPVEAKGAFSSIFLAFPTVFYTGQLAVTDILAMLRTQYDDFAERLAQIDVRAVRTLVQHQGLLPENACADVLYCYRRSELQRATDSIINEDILFTSGIGLYTQQWMARVKQAFLTWLDDTPTLVLVDGLREMRKHDAVLRECENAVLEAIIGQWSEVQIERPTIFEGYIQRVGQQKEREEESEQSVLATSNARGGKLREKRTLTRRQARSGTEQTTQENLWS